METKYDNPIMQHYHRRLSQIELFTSHLVNYQTQYQKQIDDNFQNVKMDVQSVATENEELRAIIRQMAMVQPHATSEEDGIMNDILSELKTKTNDIDGTVRVIEKDLATLKTTVDLKFNAVDTQFNDIKGLLSEIKSDIKEMKTDGVTKKRYTITTTITIIALVIAIAAGIAAWINAFK